MFRTVAFFLCFVTALAVSPVSAMAPEEVVFEETTFEEFPVLFHFPNDMSALVFVFHGAGGSERFVERLEVREIVAKLIPLGYGVVSTPSTARTAPIIWQRDSVDPEENVDLARMKRLYRDLVRRGVLGETDPVFAMGMSNGAAFTGIFGMAADQMDIPVAAVALYEGPFRQPVIAAIKERQAMPPVFQVLAVNDPLIPFEQHSEVTKAVRDGGYSVELHIAEERAVSVEDFARIPEIGEKRAQEVFNALVEAGAIDEQGRRLLDLKIDRESMRLSAIADTLKALPASADIRNQLLIAWASHKMRSDFADEQVAFFERYRRGP